jgi:hypothetical protein
MLQLDGCCDIPKMLPKNILDSCMIMVGKRGMVIHGRGRKNRYRDHSEGENSPLPTRF